MVAKKRKPAARSRSSPHPSVDAGRALLEVFETLEEEFDEAAEHVRQRPEFQSIRLSAVRPLAADRLEAGSVGWLREIRISEVDRGSPGPDEMETLVGWLYFVVNPRHSPTGGAPKPESPIVGIPVEDFAYIVECRRVPRSVLAIKSDSAESAPRLRRLAEQVREELEGAE